MQQTKNKMLKLTITHDLKGKAILNIHEIHEIKTALKVQLELWKVSTCKFKLEGEAELQEVEVNALFG